VVPTRLLDLTRLVSRLGRGPMTGIDRVECAYLTHLASRETPLFGLVRSGAGWLLLDQPGCARFAQIATAVAEDTGLPWVAGRPASDR
jgi:hypothetical protein